MGTRGPLPKRDVARAGHRAKDERAESIPADRPVPKVEPPTDYDKWDPYVRNVYDAFTSNAPITKYWERSDWAVLALTCDGMDKNRKSARFSAELHKAHMATLDSLGATEGGRRRMRLEIDRPVAPKSDASPTSTASRLTALRGGKSA